MAECKIFSLWQLPATHGGNCSPAFFRLGKNPNGAPE